MSEVAPLEVRSLAKSFIDSGNRVDLFSEISFSCWAGTTLSLQGQSGCGKTTLLNLMAGLERADAGEIFWAGQSIQGLSAKALARLRGRHLGFVFQHYCLMPELNALENVLLAWRIARGPLDTAVRTRALELLGLLGLAARADALPMVLSGGERQRLAIARALLPQPAVLLADEPTGNLDPSTGQTVIEALLQACAHTGASLVLVTHNPTFACLTHRQLKLEGGRLVGQEANEKRP